MTTIDDQPFWHYSILQYSISECSAFCLKAQDQHDLDINLLLYCAWLAQQERILEPDVLANSNISKLQQELITPLRACRRMLKTNTQGDNSSVYKEIKQTELLAEQTEQWMLYQLSMHMPQSTDGATQRALTMKNLKLYLGMVGVEVPEDWIQAAISTLYPED